jgi:two-component system, OmpR family, KDP operon response regulator KdpE
MNQPAERILIIEDEAQIRKFLRISLEAHGFGIFEARLGEPGLELCRKEKPDLVILDLGLPDIDGQQLIQRLRQWSQVPIIVLSVRSLEEEKVQALDSGANDYMTKPFGIHELVARIRVHLRNTITSEGDETTFDLGGLHIDLPQREVTVDGQSVHLSKKEYDLLHLLTTRPGQIFTHQQILHQVWSPGRENETHYLRVLIGQLRSRLGDDPSHPRFIFTVQGVGYRLALPSD